MSDVHLDPGMNDSDLVGPASIGEVLRRTREARGETLTDVAYALKLTSRQVEAMEAERFDLLPGPAFVRGFLRNYARYLGIDAAELLANFDKDAAAQSVELTPVSNAHGVMPSGGAARSAQLPAAIVAGVLLLAILAGWFFDWFRIPGADPAATTPGATAREAIPLPVQPELTPPADAPADGAASGDDHTLSAPADSMTVAPRTAEDAPTPAPAVPPLAAQASKAASDKDSAGAPRGPAATSAADNADAAPAKSVTAENAPAQAAGVEYLSFRFGGESWIEVRDAAGAIVYSGVNPAGSSRTIQGKPPFALVVGNARDVKVEFRGKPVDLQPHTRVSVARLTLE